MSEKIIAASSSNLFSGCKVISEDNFSFKHNLIKSGFCFLISLNSGRVPSSLSHYPYWINTSFFIYYYFMYWCHINI